MYTGHQRYRGRGCAHLVGDLSQSGELKNNGPNGQPSNSENVVSRPMGTMRKGDDSHRGLGRGSTRGVRRDHSRLDMVVTRPHTLKSKQGHSGKPITLVTNYFEFEKHPEFRLIQYRVEFSLEEDRTFIRKGILNRCKSMLPPFLFDGTIMFTTTPVYHAQKQELRLTSWREDRESGTLEPCVIIINSATELPSTDYRYLQVYNILLRSAMETMSLTILGRNYYDSKNVKMIRNLNLEIWPGYITSIRQHEYNVLLCADVVNKVIRTDSALEQISIARRKNINPKSGLIGSIVMTRYNKKTYRVDDIDFSRNPTSTFKRKDGSDITYAQYYLDRYQVRIRDQKQPLLVSMPKDRDRRGYIDQVILIPELCYMTGLADEMRSDSRLMKTIGEFTRMDPRRRIDNILAFAKTVTQNQECKAVLEKWGMRMGAELLKTNGRVLNPENIFMKKQKAIPYDPHKGNWTHGFQYGLSAPSPIRKWICVYPQNDYIYMNTFWKSMQSVMPGLGIFCEEPDWVETRDTRTSTYIQKLREALLKNPNFVMVIIPSEKGDAYATCKKLLCIERPVPSQFVTVSKVLSKDPQKQKSIAAKILVQMTTKLGGVPWTVNIPLKDPIMVVGFDTYHDEAYRGHSVGALVASINMNLTRYFSISQQHVPKEEISNYIPAMMTAALKNYYQINKTLPMKIIFYRDGVGDGQLQYVREVELEALKTIFPSLEDGYNPNLSYIVVSKRINTRFFVAGSDLKNPKCGTIVDDVVTLPERFDFFLVPQAVNQGTVNPTYFNVIHDTSGLRPDHIQQLTYKLCHLYYNWSGTIRVPAPCQYAHKLAFLVGKSLHAVPSPHLCDLLFYL